MDTTYLEPTPPRYPSALKLADLLRRAREIGDVVHIPQGVPLLGGSGLGELVLGQSPEGLERVGYGERLTSGQGETLHVRPEALDLGMLAGNALRAAPKVARVAARAADEALVPSTMLQAQRGAIDVGAPKLAQALRDTPDTLTAEDALRGFGEAKAKREAATAKRLEQQQASTDVVERQKGAGTRVKQEPDVYRQLYEDEGPEAVLQAAQAGEHLKPQPGGGYVGAPRTVRTGPQLGAMRKSLDDQFNRGVDALNYADPDRMGTWYDRAKAAQAEIHEPQQLESGLDQHAVYSAGVAPENELAFALKHHNSRALGTNERAYRGAGAETLDERDALRAQEGTTPEDIPALAPKIGEYRNKNDPRVAETSPFGVNDFRMAQAFGYTDPAGNPWKAGVSDTMHPFMDAETALAGQRATERGVLGKEPVTGSVLQEIPWVLNKAEDIYGRGKNARFAGGHEGMVKALREANNTIEDYLPKHAASATYEYVPGANVGHVGELLDAPVEAKRAYGAQGAWATPSPMDAEAAGMPGHVGAGERDALYRAAGFKQQPTLEAVGQYENSLGQLENNPVHIARPLMDFATGTKNEINPHTLRSVEAIEGMRGLIDAQEAAAMNLPVTQGARGGKTSLLLERGTQPSADELRRLTEALRDTGMGLTPTNRGALVMDFSGTTGPQRLLMKAGRKGRADELAAAYPGATPTQAAYEGVYVPGVTPASEAGQGIATARALQRFADAPPELARNLSESPEVRGLIGQKTERDEALGSARPDIQRTRDFFSKADWSRAVELMRQGVKPAAALGALGYSLQGMAAEQPQR
jgi:hypothetical protein